MYRFSITEGSWTSAHTPSGAINPLHTQNDPLAERQYVLSSTWAYARLSTSAEVNTQMGAWTDRGKYIKTYALEKVVFDAQRNVMYEIGGMLARQTDNTDTTDSSVLIAQQQSSGLSRGDVVLSDAVGSPFPLSNTGDHAIFLTSASGALPEPHWDRQTGEQLRERVDLPTNGFWDYSSGFTHSGAERAVVFSRAFRTYTVSPSDVVLIKEDIYQSV